MSVHPTDAVDVTTLVSAADQAIYLAEGRAPPLTARYYRGGQ